MSMTATAVAKTDQSPHNVPGTSKSEWYDVVGDGSASTVAITPKTIRAVEMVIGGLKWTVSGVVVTVTFSGTPSSSEHNAVVIVGK